MTEGPETPVALKEHGPEADAKAKSGLGGPAAVAGRLVKRFAKWGALALLAYVVTMLVYALHSYGSTKTSLISHGASEATASLIAYAVMLASAGLPALSILRIFHSMGRPLDYASAMFLPLVSWGIAQFPANFDQSGAALKYCANRPDGTLFCLDHAGVDPLTQEKLAPMDAKLARVEFRRSKGLIPKRITLPVSEIVFFDALTGEPKVWVHANEQGCFDLFDNPGVDPQSGEPLTEVDKKLVHAIKECASGSRKTSNSGEASGPATERQSDQAAAAVERPPCRVLPILNMSAMTLDSPYAGGCKYGLAEGEGSFSYRVRDRVYAVKGHFHAGKLSGNATIDAPERVIDGEFRNNLLWNTVTRGELPGGIRFAAQTREGVLYAMCRADEQEERNCTDRSLIDPSHPPLSAR